VNRRDIDRTFVAGWTITSIHDERYEIKLHVVRQRDGTTVSPR
jgi:hypothetical protein